MAGYKRKVPKEVERELVEIYLKHGFDVSATACIAHGVSPKYAANVAAALGMRRPQRSMNDHRWQWAIERGAIVA